MHLEEYLCKKCQESFDRDAEVSGESRSECPRCGGTMQRAFTTGGLMSTGHSASTNGPSEVESATGGEGYRNILTNNIIEGTGGSGVFIDGLPVDIKGGSFSNNKGGDIKIRRSAKYRISEVDFKDDKES